MKDKWQTASKLLLAPLTKWLVNLSGVPIIADVIAGGVDLVARHLDNPAAASVEQRLETLVEQILKKHAAQFDYESVAVNADAVGQALATALEALSNRPVEKIVAENLDAARLLKLAEAENAGAALSGADRELFDAALPDLIRGVVKLASAKPDYSEWEAAYLAHMLAEHNHLELFGSELEENAKRLDLGRAYVGLRVARNRGRETGQTTIRAEALLRRLAQVENGKAGRAVVLGAAGSGKTTLLRWAAVTAAQRYKHRLSFDDDGRMEKRNWRRLIPFIIRLSGAGHMPGVDEWTTECARTIGAPPAGWVNQVLTEGRGLVMIDGVDEIATFDRVACTRTIGKLAGVYPLSVFIVTSRPAAVGDGWLTQHGFEDAEIDGLARIDQEELISKWFAAVKPKHGYVPAMMAERLREKLRQTPRLALLGNNPLMLAKLCALFYRTPESMPDRPYTLVNKLITVLMHERDQERRINIDPRWHGLDDMQKRGLLRAVAMKMMLQPGGNSTLLIGTLDATLATELRQLGMAVGDMASFRKTVLERAGLLREAANDRVEFIHNTFKEFLAAQAFVDGADFDLLIGHAEDREWWPVLFFAASGESRRFPGKLIRHLLNSDTSNHDKWRMRQLIAYGCNFNSIYKIDEDLQSKIDFINDNILPPKNNLETEILQAAGILTEDSLPVYGVYQNWKSQKSRKHVKLIYEKNPQNIIIPDSIVKTSISKRFGFLGLSRAKGVSEDEFETALEVIAAECGGMIVSDYCYTPDNRVPGRRIPINERHLQGDALSEDEAWFELEHVLEKINTGKNYDNQHIADNEKVLIAVIDTGIDGARLEFQTPGKMFKGWAPLGYNPWQDDDEDVHGTMCAVIAAGSDKCGGRFRGVAPQTRLISGRSPDLNDSNLLAIYDDLLIPLAKEGYTIIANHSFGYSEAKAPKSSAPFTLFADILDDAVQAGIHLVFSAGNLHEEAKGKPDACTPNTIWRFKGRADALTVGTCDMDGKIWSYSSRGPGQTPKAPGHARKPDIVAPTPRNGLIAGPNGGSVAYELGWGTSGAAPQVAGLLALLLSIRRDLPRDELYDIVRETSVRLGGYGAACQGRGMIDCDAAITRLRSR
jgi:energy-coupling factor transporter ATP-binding protein EcfA2